MKLHILVVILMLVLGSTSCKHLNQPKYSESPIEISVDQLVSEYSEHALKADEKYKGQTVIFTGDITNTAEIRGTIGISFKPSTSSSKWKVRCLIDKSSEPDTYSKLDQKQYLTFIGIVGPNTGTFPIDVFDCKIK
jgi:hypothetical protein